MAVNAASGRQSCLIVLPSCKEGTNETPFRLCFVKHIWPYTKGRSECSIHAIRVETFYKSVLWTIIQSIVAEMSSVIKVCM
jgi:hypothetical protein